MRRIRGGVLAVAAAAAGVGLAVAVGSAGADSTTTTVTLGSATGTPNQNICLAQINCTYVPFDSADNPGLQVPVDGNVTSFSVNVMGGGPGATVQLRVLRPAGDGRYTGAGTSASETLANNGLNTFTTSLPVKAGDVLGLDNSTSALIFDGSSPDPAFTAFYELPSLSDGSTAAPNRNKTNFHLLLSATVVGTKPNNTTTTNGTTITTTRSGGTVTVTKTVRPKPVIGNPTQSSTAWNRSRGTTFAFGLSSSAKCQFVFRQRTGRRGVVRGRVSLSGHPGTDRLRFNGRMAGGKKLGPGRYTVTITATNNAGSSRSVTMSFQITG